ncbi:MAG: hypothetical protein ABI811_17815 [Acidobacteriota bacterium]
MDFAAAAFSSIVSITAFVLFAAGVLKLFQIHTSLGEIRELLQGIRAQGGVGSAVPRVANIPSSYAPSRAPEPIQAGLDTRSGEEMLRALDAQMHMEEATALNPEIVERN